MQYHKPQQICPHSGQTHAQEIIKKMKSKLKVSFYGKTLILKWKSKIFYPHKKTFVNTRGKLLHAW